MLPHPVYIIERFDFQKRKGGGGVPSIKNWFPEKRTFDFPSKPLWLTSGRAICPRDVTTIISQPSAANRIEKLKKGTRSDRGRERSAVFARFPLNSWSAAVGRKSREDRCIGMRTRVRDDGAMGTEDAAAAADGIVFNEVWRAFGAPAGSPARLPLKRGTAAGPGPDA